MVIGISGKPRRGKDLLAKAMAKDFHFTVIHFADALYREIESMHTITHVGHWWGDWVDIDGIKYTSQRLCDKVGEWLTEAQKTQTNRRGIYAEYKCGDVKVRSYKDHQAVQKDPLMLQWWGTEYRRSQFGMNYWVEKLDDEVRHMAQDGSRGMLARRIIVADVRFKNEAAWVKTQVDGRLVRVNSNKPFEATGRDDNHIAETDLDDYDKWDAVIDNNFDEMFLVIGLSVADRWLDEEGEGLKF